MEIKFTIAGEPRTKKNSQRIISVYDRENDRMRPVPLPSKQYSQYSDDFIWQVPYTAKKKIATPINLKCCYYMRTRRRVDLTNLLEASCDILVAAGVIDDDNSKIVVGHDGSRVFYDKDNPRTEIEITDVDGTFF